MSRYLLLFKANAQGARALLGEGSSGFGQTRAVLTEIGGRVESMQVLTGAYDVALTVYVEDSLAILTLNLLWATIGVDVEICEIFEPEMLDEANKMTRRLAARLQPSTTPS